MTGTRDWLTRERGSRDWRLLPAAICGWAASLAAHAGFAYCISHDGMLGALPAVLTCMIPLAVLAGLPFPRLLASVRRRITLWHASVTVCAIAAMVCAASALTYDLLQWRDPASRAAAEGDASVVVMARATSPTVISDRRSNDCRADARITSVTIDGVRQTSSARARIYADRPECGKLKQDGTYKIAGRISEARYGAMPLWLTDVTTVEHVRPPNLPMRAIGMMQEAFFVQTARLSDQGESARPRTDIGCSRTGLRAGRRRWRRHRFHIRRTGGGRVPKVRNRASHGGQRRPSGRDRRIGAFRLLVLPSAATIHRTAGRHVVHHAVGMRVSVGFGIPRAFDGIVRRGMPVHRQTRPGDGVVELDHIGYADGMPAHVAKLPDSPCPAPRCLASCCSPTPSTHGWNRSCHGSWPRLCP